MDDMDGLFAASDAYERDLIRRIVDGDREAIFIIIERYAGPLRAFLLPRLYGVVDRIDDVLQDIWMAIWYNASSFEARSTVETWIYGIARNKAGTVRKSAEFRRARSHSPLDDRTASADRSDSLTIPSSEDAVIRLVDASSALSSLPKKYRVALVLYVNGLDAQELAVVLDVPVSRVKSCLHIAREALRAEVAERSLPSPRISPER